MGKIIQRDFFLEKLKAHHDYHEAVERNDVPKLRELYTKYSGPRPPTERISSSATSETPSNIHNSQTLETQAENPEMESASQAEARLLRLDQFLNLHTFQDNESFEKLIIDGQGQSPTLALTLNSRLLPPYIALYLETRTYFLVCSKMFFYIDFGTFKLKLPKFVCSHQNLTSRSTMWTKSSTML